MKIFFCVMLLLIVCDGYSTHSYTNKLAKNWNDQVEQLMIQSMIDNEPRKLAQRKPQKLRRHRRRRLHSSSDSLSEEGVDEHLAALKQEFHDLIRHYQKKKWISNLHKGTHDEDLDTSLMEDDESSETLIALKNRIKELEAYRERKWGEETQDKHDNWFIKGVKDTAKAIGLHTTSDAAIAGLGTAALLSGAVAGEKNYKNRRRLALGLEKASVFSEMTLAFYVRNNQLIKQIGVKCGQVNARISAVENQIVGDLTRQIDWNTSYK